MLEYFTLSSFLCHLDLVSVIPRVGLFNISYFFRSWIFYKIGFVDSSECDFQAFLRFRNFGIIVLLSIVYNNAQIFLVVFRVVSD